MLTMTRMMGRGSRGGLLPSVRGRPSLVSNGMGRGIMPGQFTLIMRAASNDHMIIDHQNKQIDQNIFNWKYYVEYHHQNHIITPWLSNKNISPSRHAQNDDDWSWQKHYYDDHNQHKHVMILITITKRHVPSPGHDLSFRSRHFVFAWPSLSYKVGKILIIVMVRVVRMVITTIIMMTVMFNDASFLSKGVVLRVLLWKEQHQDTAPGLLECPPWRDPECRMGEQSPLVFTSGLWQW